MTPMLELLATFRPPQPLLDYLNGHKKMSAEAKRWLSVWPHWDAWLVELEKRATDDDRRLLEELIAIFDPKDVIVTELPQRLQEEPQQIALIEVPEKRVI